MNFATTKERLLQFIDFKGLTTSKFLQETGIKRGFLDTDKLKSSVSDNFIAIIIAKYPELNLEWLITGNGKMIITKKSNLDYDLTTEEVNNAFHSVNEPKENYGSGIDILKDYNNHLKKEVEELKKDKSLLQLIIESKLINH